MIDVGVYICDSFIDLTTGGVCVLCKNHCSMITISLQGQSTQCEPQTAQCYTHTALCLIKTSKLCRPSLEIQVHAFCLTRSHPFKHSEKPIFSNYKRSSDLHQFVLVHYRCSHISNIFVFVRFRGQNGLCSINSVNVLHVHTNLFCIFRFKFYSV